MLVPVREELLYMYRHTPTCMGPDTFMIFFLTQYAFSHEELIVAT